MLIPEGAELIAHSKSFLQTLARARRFARTQATVLVTGESGTGKEQVARFIHQHSARSAGPLVPVNTGAIPESLLESELFGYLRGAFTGADRDTQGLFAAAQGGTLFLDEVGEMSASMQSKLLRVLQEREVRPVGSRAAIAVDARVITATNADLVDLVGAGRFREDLYYRLNVLSVHVPALRERREDILPLARHFLAAAQRHPAAPLSLSTAAGAALTAYHWPGNVRELENAVEHAVALTDGSVVRREALPETVLGRARTPRRRAIGESITLAEVERLHIEAVLEATGGNRTRAAEILGVAPSTLWRRTRRG
ncbi:MAG: sigma 54-interacting transcriptional regulator [Polyangiales bacterium]